MGTLACSPRKAHRQRCGGNQRKIVASTNKTTASGGRAFRWRTIAPFFWRGGGPWWHRRSAVAATAAPAGADDAGACVRNGVAAPQGPMESNLLSCLTPETLKFVTEPDVDVHRSGQISGSVRVDIQRSLEPVHVDVP